MKRWYAAIPLIALLILGAVGASQLMNPEKPGFEEATLRPAPVMAFERLRGEGEIRFAPPENGETVVVNLFASWCAPCRVEHPLLMDLALAYPEQVYGLAYKDAPENTLQFLADLGDPYADIGKDRDGQGGLDFGLTGVPETFVIDGDGQIVMHVRGVLDPESLGRIEDALAE
ncbi:MAG: redoxin family protein [Henriciella sp.]|nr:redoxin family protein [Henriciella sp.]